MNTESQMLLDEKVEALASAYARQGFTVLKEPASGQLPFDLGGYKPDILVTRGETGLVIEVKTTTSAVSVERFQSIAEKVSSRPGWRFLLITLDDVDASSVPTTTDELPEWEHLWTKLRQAEALIASGGLESGLLYLWSIFEAMLRKRAIALHVPIERLPVSKLLNHLYTLGQVSVDDIDVFREFMSIRNRIAHGGNTVLDGTFASTAFVAVNRLLKEWSGQGGTGPEPHATV